MTDLATKARAAAEHAPVMLHARREHTDSHAALITFEVSLDDMPDSVKGAKPGDHFLLVLVPIDKDGGQPKIQPKTRGQRLNALAHTICDEPEFQAWACQQSRYGTECEPKAHDGRDLILNHCAIVDRGELTRNEAACDRFEALLDQYERSRGKRYFRSAI